MPLLFFACALFGIPVVSADTPVFRVLTTVQTGTPLLQNGDFETEAARKPANWTSARNGFVLAEAEGRNGSRALRCENPQESGWAGASQTLSLNRTSALPLVVRGWSKAKDISGGADSGYALYVDIVYTDGTPLWGQTANFHTGTHDWEKRELTIIPQRPIQSLTLHCILRGHAGTAWFDDVSIEEVGGQPGATVFQGVPILPADASGGTRRSTKHPATVALATRDGLKLLMDGSTVSSLQLGDKEAIAQATPGFLVRDFAANSGFYEFTQGRCDELGLRLTTQYRAEADHVLIEGRVSDLTGKDRAVTLVFALPIEVAGWRWGDDIRRSRVIQGDTLFANEIAIHCGATGTMSQYPLAAIYGPQQGLALGLDMATPAQYRLGYHAGLRELFIAYDFGLVPETRSFPSSADFRFVLFRFEPSWGFRAAFRKYMDIFPEFFRVRSRDQGLWMPFTDVSTVQDWQDFGFRYHEGNNNVPWDDAHNVLSFRYTEPMTWWMRMDKDLPRTIPEALRIRDQLAASGRATESEMAQVSRVAAMWDETGQPALLFRNEPWCNGAVWSLNPNPALSLLRDTSGERSGSASTRALNAATVHWNEAIKQRLYGPAAKGHLDGEYLDSLEGYVTSDLNFRRDHFRQTSVPLTFASDSKQPALFKGLAVLEFTRWIAEDVHRLGKLMFANGVPYRFTFLCPWLDVLGTETDWLQQGKYHPASDSQMSLWRTMSGAKPYLLLMNTDYDRFDSAMVERYFQRSLFYGMFPGMFSHNAADNPYWQNPKWYNRDRPLFKKYVPLVKRVAEAGWQPVTYASCDNDRMLIERFGAEATSPIYFTVFNDTAIPQHGSFRVDAKALRRTGAVRLRDLFSGALANGVEITLESQHAKVYELDPATE